MERITKRDWAVIHEALCYVSQHSEDFEKWLLNRGKGSDERVLHWIQGKDVADNECKGHWLISKTFDRF